MRVTYHWTEADWNEAVTLATEKPRRRGNVPAMVYALVGIPLIGAVMDGVRSVRGTGKLTGAGMTVPILLILLAAVLGGGLFLARQQRHKRVLALSPMPTGQWEAVLQESGWSFHPKLEVVPESPHPEDAVGQSASAHAATEGADRPVAEAKNIAASPPVDDALNAGGSPENIVVAASESALAAPTQAESLTGLEIESASAMKDEPAAVQTPGDSALEAAHLPTHVDTPPALASAASATEALARPTSDTSLHPWNDLTGSRTGDRAIVFLHHDGFCSLPIRCLTPDQAGHLHRMMIRKLRPAATATAIRRRR